MKRRRDTPEEVFCDTLANGRTANHGFAAWIAPRRFPVRPQKLA
jgi:hypothetical protein